MAPTREIGKAYGLVQLVEEVSKSIISTFVVKPDSVWPDATSSLLNPRCKKVR